ncbi:MAG: hypothetical protein QW388_03010 [Thermoplasmatales archaeon]
MRYPIVLGQYDLLAPQAFLNLSQAIDEERVRLEYFITLILLIINLILFLAMRQRISLTNL